MVVEQKADLIVMVTRTRESGREKAAQYWPDTAGATRQYGPASVTLMEESEDRDCVQRSLLVRDQTGSSRDIKHVQFTSWPEASVPESAAVFEGFLRKMRPLRGSCTVVHCDGGVGRTGCVIAADRQLDRFEIQGDIDVFDDVVLMRECRPNMVNSADQFVFLHQVMLDAVTAESARIVPGVTPEYSDYLRSLVSDDPTFDVGHPGRRLEHLFPCMVLSAGVSPRAGHLAVCNDVVWVSEAGNANRVIAPPVHGSKVRYQDAQQDWDEPLLRIDAGGNRLVLEAASEREKEAWMSALSDPGRFQATADLSGPRVVTAGKMSKVDVAKLLDVPFPYNEEGASNLIKEFEKIPKVCVPRVDKFEPLRLSYRCNDVAWPSLDVSLCASVSLCVSASLC